MSDQTVQEILNEQTANQTPDVIEDGQSPIEAPKIDLSRADAIIAKIAEARREDNKNIKTTYEKLKDRVQEQLPKNYKLKLELDNIKTCTHPRLRVDGPDKFRLIDINSKKLNIHESLATALKWAFRDLADRKIARIWKVDNNEGKNE